jgi:hypothetical protein
MAWKRDDSESLVMPAAKPALVASADGEKPASVVSTFGLHVKRSDEMSQSYTTASIAVRIESESAGALVADSPSV